MEVNKEIAGIKSLNQAGYLLSVAHSVISPLNESKPLFLIRTRLRWAAFRAQCFMLKATIKTSHSWIRRLVTEPLDVISRHHPKRLTTISIAKLLFLIALIACQPFGYATTYYIDSERGNDFWTGKLPTAASTSSMEGPWQTLNRLATAAMVPGDSVYLACGSTWNETLRVTSSGTSAAPILISAGPDTCETPPAIEGAVVIPSHMWTQYKGAIYRARLPIEYISNPGLSENVNGWSIWSRDNDASISLDSTCSGSPLPCMEFVSGAETGYSIAISNNFPLSAGVNYSTSVQIRAPAGTRVKFAIRRGGPTYESLVADQFITASGSWQTIRFTFAAARSAPNARFDIEIPNGRIRTNLREAHVRRVMPTGDVISTFIDGAAVRRAHHPNFGRTGADPDSPYGVIASAGGKTTLDIEGLTLPPEASLTPGLGVSIRTDNFALEERGVARVSGNLLTLDKNTQYPIKSGYGYFLTGALWMLDAPGEWYFDSSTGDLYIWMPEGGSPGGRVSFSSLEVGVNLRSKAHVDLVGLDIRRVGVGVQISTARSVQLRNLAITETANHGIEADSSISCTVEQSSIINTGLDAIKAVGGGTTGFIISDSSVIDSGTLDRTDSWRKLPRPARAAINVGPNATISRNQVIGAANNGMFLGHNSTVENNHVSRSCVILNDCGGIYSNFAGTNTSISGNVVDNISGGLAGLQANAFSQTAGIYLDEHATDVQVRGNTVTGADYGVQIHDAYRSTVAGNLLFGNRRYQLWIQEQAAKLRSGGDTFGNKVESNLMVPTTGGPSVLMESEIGDTGDFASFQNNHYSALISPRPVSESWPNGSASYNLEEWMAKGQDAGARVTQPGGYASFLTSGGTIVPNGNFTNGATGWTWWNETAPYARVSLRDCEVGPCLEITAGGSPSLLASPNFSITAGQWYRVSFDAAASHPGQPINVLVRRERGGTAGYEALMPAAESFSGSTGWQRYSFLYRASKTVIASDLSPGGEKGARIDFERIQPGSSLRVAKLEIVPLTPSQAALQLRLQLNASRESNSVSCAPADEAAALCDKFIYVKDGSRVDWGASVQPRSGNVIYTRDTSLVDTDRDGIADVQDACPETRESTAVNARGCGLDQ